MKHTLIATSAVAAALIFGACSSHRHMAESASESADSMTMTSSKIENSLRLSGSLLSSATFEADTVEVIVESADTSTVTLRAVRPRINAVRRCDSSSAYDTSRRDTTLSATAAAKTAVYEKKRGNPTHESVIALLIFATIATMAFMRTRR